MLFIIKESHGPFLRSLNLFFNGCDLFIDQSSSFKVSTGLSESNAAVWLLLTLSQPCVKGRTRFEKPIMVQASGIRFSTLGPVLVSTRILSSTSSREGNPRTVSSAALVRVFFWLMNRGQPEAVLNLSQIWQEGG